MKREADRSQTTGDPLAGAALVVAFGGDNHFQFVSQSARGELPILGINSDAQTSFGALLSATAEELPLIIEALKTGTFEFESWARLALTLDGKKLEAATSEVFAGEVERKFMSRHVLSRESQCTLRSISPDEQKGSGFLVATGAGSSGWYQSAARYIHAEGTSYPKTDLEAHFVQTEPSTTVVRPGKPRTRAIPAHSIGNLLPGETLRIQSLNDQHGIVTVDSLAEYSFPRGQVLEVALADEPLWVITFPKGFVC